MTRPVPDGFHTITPHLVVADARAAMTFYREAFGAEETFCNQIPDGPVLNAQMRIGDSLFMLNDEFPDQGALGPRSGQATPVTIHLYVEDVDALYQRAEQAGATVLMPLADTFWGDRYAMLQDPAGNRWSLASRIEDLSSEQMMERAAQAMGGGAS